ncbi:MAG: class I SAM-dependent methyltransferase [Pseudomonadota bacterium]
MEIVRKLENKKIKPNLFVQVLRDLGHDTERNAKILDFGCGNGDLVRELKESGFDTYGCDIDFEKYKDVNELLSAGIVRKISELDYRIPFPDHYFDFVFSDQVLEHVQNYQTALSEISRVLKPSGVSLHIFPSRYRLIETHVYVPLGSIIQRQWWLSIWANLGIRNSNQKGKSAAEVTQRNYRYLTTCTNYLRKSDIRRYFRMYFTKVDFIEREYLKNTRKGIYVYKLSRIPLLAFLPALYSTFRSRVVISQKSV